MGKFLETAVKPKLSNLQLPSGGHFLPTTRHVTAQNARVATFVHRRTDIQSAMRLKCLLLCDRYISLGRKYYSSKESPIRVHPLKNAFTRYFRRFRVLLKDSLLGSFSKYYEMKEKLKRDFCRKNRGVSLEWHRVGIVTVLEISIFLINH